MLWSEVDYWGEQSCPFCASQRCGNAQNAVRQTEQETQDKRHVNSRKLFRACIHLTVESYTLVMLLTVILIICRSLSPPHSFIPGLKPSLSANPSHHSFIFFFRTDYMDSPDRYTIDFLRYANRHHKLKFLLVKFKCYF